MAGRVWMCGIGNALFYMCGCVSCLWMKCGCYCLGVTGLGGMDLVVLDGVKWFYSGQ